MNKRFGRIILNTAFRYMVPFILVYGSYVLFHGEYSPGGGFQAGALFAIGIVLTRLVQDEKAMFNISGDAALILAGFGAFIYGGLGLLTILLGGNMLEYGVLPFNLSEP
jgi:multicomponent Na+:H+ antiporter subunit B